MNEVETPELEKEVKPSVKKRETDDTDDTKEQFIGNILIEDLRGQHIGKIVSITAILKDYTKVLPRIIKAKFDCPSCGTVISVLQLGDWIKEPTRCSCGRKGGFKISDKDQVDFQILKIREEPEKISSDRIKRTIKVFLKEHLTNVELEKTLKLERKINIIGKIIESSSDSTTSSLSLEAMYFTIGNQKGDNELLNYLIDFYNIPKIQAQFLIVVRNNFYNLSKSFLKYGISNKTHYRWLKDSEYANAYEYIETGKIDFLESEIIKKIKYASDNISADMLKFYAKTKMGYVEKQKIEHSGNISSDSAEEMRKIWEECNANQKADIDSSGKE